MIQGTMTRRAVWLALLLVAFPFPAAAAGAGAPDSTTLASMNAELSRAMAARVTTSAGKQTLRDVRLDDFGIASAQWGPGAAERPALITSASAMPPSAPAPVPWNEITRIERGTTPAARDAVLGMTIGALLGVIVWETVPTGYDGGRGDAAVVIGVPALVGFGLGLILGADHYRWETVYRR